MAATLEGSWSTYTTDTIPLGSATLGSGTNRKHVEFLNMEKSGAQTVTTFTIGGQTYDESFNLFVESGGAGDLTLMGFIWKESTIATMSGSAISIGGVNASNVETLAGNIQDTDQGPVGYSSASTTSGTSVPVSVTADSDDFVIGNMVDTSANRAPLTDDTLTEVNEYSVSGHASRVSSGVGGASTITFSNDLFSASIIGATVTVFKGLSGAPILTVPTDTQTGTTTASGTVVSDIASGTVYAVVTTSTTTPSAAQIIAGNDHLGAAADATDSVAATVGTNNLSFTGLTASTQYYTHYAQDDTVDSAAVSASGFVTQGGTPTLSLPTDVKTGSVTSTGTVTSDTAGGVVYGVVTESATTPSHAQIVAAQDHTSAPAKADDNVVGVASVNNLSFSGLLQATAYFTHYAQTGGTPATPVSATGFTTDANGAPFVDTPIPDQVCTIGVAFGPLDVSGNFDDPDGDTLTFTQTGLPNGLVISSVGVISGTPTGGFQP